MKKVLICVDMTKDSLSLSKKTLKEIDVLGFDQIHLVHAFKENVYDFDFYFTTYPIKEDFEKINQSVLDNLNNLITASEISSKDKVITNCIISDSPKESIDSYIKENNIDVVYVSTRGKYGMNNFFASSFAEYLLRHTAAELRVTRS